MPASATATSCAGKDSPLKKNALATNAIAARRHKWGNRFLCRTEDLTQDPIVSCLRDDETSEGVLDS